jgi:hypothetical protein
MFKILSTYSRGKKYIKCNIWSVAVRLSYIQDARFLKVKPMRLIFYELQCIVSSSSIIYLCPDDGLVIEAETCHLVTLNKINIHNTSCILTCESLLLICIHRTQRG